jgi:hypothetical protein
MSLLLTMNPDRDQHLAYHLKQKCIPVTKLKVGDIVVTCHTCFHVTKIKQQGEIIYYYDELDNGSTAHINGSVNIIKRKCINKSNWHKRDKTHEIL